MVLFFFSQSVRFLLSGGVAGGVASLAVAGVFLYLGAYYFAQEICVDERSLDLISLGRRRVCPRTNFGELKETRDGWLIASAAGGAPVWRSLRILWRQSDLRSVRALLMQPRS
jgi:hypothetical protein